MNYDQILNEKIQGIKPSGIRKFFDILEEMTDAISLGIGEPDFVTPWHIRDAGIYSLEKGFTPIINPPQSAILGIHATKPRPVAENGEVVIRPMNYFAMSYDHQMCIRDRLYTLLIAG